MRNLILFLISCPLFLNAQQDYWALIHTNCSDYTAARELREQLVDDGHLISLIYHPQWMVARLQVSPNTIMEQHTQILAIDEGSDTSQDLKAPLTLSAFFEKMTTGRFGPSVKNKPDETFSIGFDQKACAYQEPIIKTRTDQIPRVNDYNSEYFSGLVTTSVLFIESDGSEDPNYYSWTQEALEEEKLDVLMALHTWAYTAYLQEVDLTFIPVWYDNRPEVGQGLEPNLHLGSFDFYSSELNRMTGSVLNNLGYKASYTRAQGDNFNYDQQQAYESDFAFTIGIHYSHLGKGYIRANAMIGGPITYLSREYDYRVYGHEIGHIFHAFDEYLNTQNCDPATPSFNGAINGNNLANSCLSKQTCVMNNNAILGEGDELQFAVCSFTATHFGWTEQALAPAPQILTKPNEAITLPFFKLDAEFPTRRDPLKGYVKIWQINDGHDSLTIADELGTVNGSISWINPTPLLPGTYKCVFYHGQKGIHALVPSKPLLFDVDYSPVFPLRDSCFYFCQTPEEISFPQNNLRWYGDRDLQILIQEGNEYTPDFQTDSTLYLVHYDGSDPVDITQVNILFGRPGSLALQSRIEQDGRIALSFYSFIPLQNVQSIQWYKNGEPLPGATDWNLYVTEPGAYHIIITNGCTTKSNTFELILPPQIERNALCDQNSYQLVAEGENIQWYDERQTPVATTDTLIVTDAFRFQLYFVTQTIDGVESPFYEIPLHPLNEEERIDLINK